MSEFITTALLVFIGLFCCIILIELIMTRKIKRTLLEVAILAVIVVILRLTTGFPATRTSFGSESPALALFVICFGTILGMVAQYFFYLKGKFSWRAFLKPLFISPMILLPLVGSIQGATRFETMQILSIGFLAFQNGFFWQVVFEHAKNQNLGNTIQKSL